jgi:hypothetical protein
MIEPVSNTTWFLLKYSKSENSVFSFQELGTALSDMYHPDMELIGVVHILIESLQEIINEPRFKVHYGPGIMKKVILAPIDRSYFIPEPTSLLEMYELMICEIMNAFRFTTVDWCKEKLV